MGARNHDLEAIYMTQLRNAETCAYVLYNKLRNLDANINRLNTPIAKTKMPTKPQRRDYINIGTVAILIMPFILLWLMGTINNVVDELLGWLSLFKGAIKFFDVFSWVIFFALLLGCVIYLIVQCKDYAQAEAYYNKRIQENQITDMESELQTQRNFAAADQLMLQRKSIQRELSDAQSLLRNLYDLNWIPAQYRNIHAVYYIHRMVCTSDVSIKETFQQYQMYEMNNKLDKVLQEMGRIIENQHDIIIQQARQESQNRRMIQQNYDKIRYLAQIEENSRLAADYTELAAQYTKANAYINLARYISR